MNFLCPFKVISIKFPFITQKPISLFWIIFSQGQEPIHLEVKVDRTFTGRLVLASHY